MVSAPGTPRSLVPSAQDRPKSLPDPLALWGKDVDDTVLEVIEPAAQRAMHVIPVLCLALAVYCMLLQ
jgi:hypothetical protein